MKGTLLFLGSGGSLGIPVIGCSCEVCLSSSLFNQRLRPSVLLILGEKIYLIDAGPDFRIQALKYHIHKLEGVFLTHSHYDHIGGFDDLRIFYFHQKKALPCLLSRETFKQIKIRYHYLMPSEEKFFHFKILEDDKGKVLFEDLQVRYFSYTQKGTKVTGFRFGNFAYVVDILDYSKEIFVALEGIEILVIDGMAWEKTQAHLGIHEVIEISQKVGAQKTYLTHVAHEIEHKKTNQKLPDGVEMAYDGLKIGLEVEI